MELQHWTPQTPSILTPAGTLSGSCNPPDRSTSFTVIELDLSSAGSRTIEFAGRVIQCMYATDSAAANGLDDGSAMVQCRLNATTAPPLYIRLGSFQGGLYFQRLELSWSAQTGKTLYLHVFADDEPRVV